MYRSRIRLANCSKSRSNCCLILFLSVTGVGMNLSPFDITPTSSSVNGVSERFLRYFSFVSLSMAARPCAVFNLRCFQYLSFPTLLNFWVFSFEFRRNVNWSGVTSVQVSILLSVTKLGSVL